MFDINFIIISCLLFGTLQACSESLVGESSTSTSTHQKAIERIEKKDLLKRVMAAMPKEMDAHSRNTLFGVAVSILGESFETVVRNIVSADGKNTFGHNFPLDPEVLRDVMDLSQGKKVLEIAAANGENAFLLGLSGAERVFINDIEPTEIEKCRKRLESLPIDTQAKFTLVPGDCLKVFERDEYTECFDVIYARNIMHFLFGEKREQFIQTVQRLLKPGGHLIITANSARRLIAAGKIKDISHEYVFKQRAYKLRLPEGHVNLLQTFAVEENLTDVDPVRYRFVPVITFTKAGPKEEAAFKVLNKDVKETLQDCAADCIDRFGIQQLALHKRTIECHESQTIAYTQATLEQAFAGKNLVAKKIVTTGLLGHVTVQENEELHVTMFFEKLPRS